MKKLLLPLVCALFLLAAPAGAEPARVLNSDVFTLQDAAVAVGNGSPMNVDGYNTVVFQVTIATTATITFEGSTHTAFSSIPCVNKATSAVATTATATGVYQCDVAGLSTVRPRISAWTAGAVTVYGRASVATPSGTTSISGGDANISQFGGSNVVSGGLAGSQSIGGTATNDAAITQNPVLTSCEALSTQPTAATTGNQRRCVSSLDGIPYVRQGGPIQWNCQIANVGTTLTECQPAPGAGLKLYITDLTTISTTATGGLYTIRYGTGTNCGTGTGNLLFATSTVSVTNGANTGGLNVRSFLTPLIVPANNAICVLGVVTNTTDANIHGYTAP